MLDVRAEGLGVDNLPIPYHVKLLELQHVGLLDTYKRERERERERERKTEREKEREREREIERVREYVAVIWQ